MKFSSKIDKVFLFVISITIIIVGLVCIIPLFLDKQRDVYGIVIMVSIFILTVGFILWTSFSISYIFLDNQLLIKSGPIKKRISYNEITRVRSSKDIFTGYRILSSIDAIAISYHSGWLGEIKISPKDKAAFLKELKTKAPNVII